jgi:hypothetical protein
MPGPKPTFHDSQRIADLWRGRLLEARKKYDLSVTEVKTAGTDFTAGTLPAPDGSQHMVNSLRAETIARKEYLRILQIFTDLVVSGKSPEE